MVRVHQAGQHRERKKVETITGKPMFPKITKIKAELLPLEAPNRAKQTY